MEGGHIVTSKEFSDTFDKIIQTFSEEAGNAINYCPTDEISTPLAETHKAVANAMESIKRLLLMNHEM